MIFSFYLHAQIDLGTFTDPRDGNTYKQVQIGTQIWMAENLKYLPSVNNSSYYSNTSPYYYVYDYEGYNVNEAKSTFNYNTFGVLYNWPAAMNGHTSSHAIPSGVQGVCPSGWHLPSKGEWENLIRYLVQKGYNYDGSQDGFLDINDNKLGKAIASKNFWKPAFMETEGDVDTEPEKNNSSGFNGLPSGTLNDFYDGAPFFDDIGVITEWWTASEKDGLRWYTELYAEGNCLWLAREYARKRTGSSVRCVSDEEVTIQPTISVQVRPCSEDWSNWSWDHQEFNDAYFVAAVEISSSVNTENIEIEAKIGDNPMNIILADLDLNLDEKIDILRDYKSIFYIYSNELSYHLENKLLSIKVTSSNEDSINYEYRDKVSMYFLKDDNGEPYSFFRDSYQFSNYDDMTFKEFVNEIEAHGTKVNLSLAGFKYLAVNNGRCFGMAASAGAYFKMPWLKPISGYPFDWGVHHYDAHHSVISNINSYHLNQAIGITNRTYQELDDVIPSIKTEITNGYPVVLSCNDTNGIRSKHAYLATKITEFGNQNLKAIQIYENEFSGMKDILLKSDGSIMNGEAVYDEFYQFGREVFEPFDPRKFENRIIEQLLNTVVDNNSKLFCVACPVRLFVVGNNNRRAGFDEEGIEYNEIEGAEVERYLTGDGEFDYVTYITVPAENECMVQLFAYEENQISFEYYAPNNTDILMGNLNEFTMYKNTYAIFDESKSQLELIIDDNGDWETDRTLPLELKSPLFADKGITQSFLKIYPNPVKGQFRISCDSDLPFSLTISTDKGEIIRELKSLTNTLEIDLSTYAQGIYFITIRSKDFVTTRKIVKL